VGRTAKFYRQLGRKIQVHHNAFQKYLTKMVAGADWEQKASAAIGFVKAIETLWKKPNIALKKPQFH
jgi:hypothetical protein